MDPLVADGLAKSYGGTAALSGVSLACGAGEVLALVGPNGAGKTTLVRCLTGTTRPDAGSARLFGDDPRSADRSRLGLLPQEFAPPDRLTPRELVAYYGGLYDRARDPDAVLADVGVEDAADTWYADLSGGEKRRVGVGTALVNDPDVLFLDEPTTGIDPAGRRAVWGLIEDLAAGGTTIFLTSHSMAEVERLADRVGVLVSGTLVALDTPAGLVAAHGGESRLVVETDAPVGAVDGVDAALPVGGIELERTDRGLTVRGVEPADIGKVVEALGEAGVDYDALSWRKPDLESVYLALAGEVAEGAAELGEAGGAATDPDPDAPGGERV